MTRIYSDLEVAGFEKLSSDPATLLFEGRFVWNDTTKQAKVYDGTQWRTMGGAGGGAGANWHGPDGEAPLESEENGEKVWLFQKGLSQQLYLWLKVPESYAPGTQVTCKIGLYSPSTSNTIFLKSSTFLVRKNVTAVGDTALGHSSTNLALTNPATANQYRETELDLSDGSGQVSATAIAAGDLLRVRLFRTTDTDTADIRFIPSATEPVFS